MSDVQGYKVLAKSGREQYDIDLIASSEKAAISRARGTMTHGTRDMRWMKAEYTIVEIVSLEQFSADRKAGLR